MDRGSGDHRTWLCPLAWATGFQGLARTKNKTKRKMKNQKQNKNNTSRECCANSSYIINKGMKARAHSWHQWKVNIYYIYRQIRHTSFTRKSWGGGIGRKYSCLYFCIFFFSFPFLYLLTWLSEQSAVICSIYHLLAARVILKKKKTWKNKYECIHMHVYMRIKRKKEKEWTITNAGNTQHFANHKN